MIDVELQKLWTSYVATEEVRIKAASEVALSTFIARMLKIDPLDRDAWAQQLALDIESGRVDVPVRLPLFRQVIFPALKVGIEHDDGRMARCLVDLWDRVVHARELLEQLPEKLRSIAGLLEFALERDPADDHSRRRLVEMTSDFFMYSLHELPSGVLHGTNGATVAQCSDLLEELKRFELHVDRLRLREKYDALIHTCAFHFKTYRAFLNAKSGGSYEAYFTALQQ